MPYSQTLFAKPNESFIPPVTPSFLIVDDNALNRKIIANQLAMVMKNNCGSTIDIQYAENGQIAVEKARERISVGNPYDVIIMDYEMPVKNGADATCEIRKLETSGKKSFILTCSTEEQWKTKHYDLANGKLSKPVKAAEFQQLFAKYFTSRSNPEPCRQAIIMPRNLISA